jgi:hypothetical protein
MAHGIVPPNRVRMLGAVLHWCMLLAKKGVTTVVPGRQRCREGMVMVTRPGSNLFTPFWEPPEPV